MGYNQNLGNLGKFITTDSSGNITVTGSVTGGASSFTTGAFSGNVTAGTNDITGGRIFANATSPLVQAYSASGGEAILRAYSSSNYWDFSVASSVLNFKYNGTTKVSIDNTGALSAAAASFTSGTFSADISIVGGSIGTGKIAYSSTYGINISGKAGSSYDMTLWRPAGAGVIGGNPTGTGDWAFFGNVRNDGNISIGTTDLTSYSTNYGTINLNGSTGAALRYYVNNANPLTQYLSASGWDSYTAAAYQYRWYASGTNIMTLAAAGNLGIGVTPSNWSTIFRAIDFIGGSAIASRADGTINQIQLMANTYYDATASNWKYKASTYATKYYQNAGEHHFEVAASGTAGNTPTWLDAFNISNTGAFGNSNSTAISGSQVFAAINTSSTGYGAYIRGGNGTNYGLYVTNYDGTQPAVSVLPGNTGSGNVNTQILVGTTAASQTNVGRSLIAINGVSTSLLEFQTGSTFRGYLYHSGTDFQLYNSGTGEIEMIANTSGVKLTNGATSWAAISDERTKLMSEFKPFADAMDKIMTLRAGTSRYLTDAEDVSRSFLIAQDVQKVLPEAISISSDSMLVLRYSDVIPLMISAQKEVYSQLLALQQEFEEYKKLHP